MKIVKKVKLNPLLIFSLLVIISVLLFLIISFFRGPYMMSWIAMENEPVFIMSDYFRYVKYAQDLKDAYYTVDGPFAPLAYLIFHFIFKITNSEPIPKDFHFLNLPSQPWQMGVYIMYLVLAIMLFCFVANELTNDKKYGLLLSLAMFLSFPMSTGAIERGNIVLYLTILILLALLWHDSENRIKREASLIFIGLATGLKIYPFIIGFVFIGEKRYKDAVKVFVYSALFFFIPFFFMDGIISFLKYIMILTNYAGISNFGRMQFFNGFVSTVLGLIFPNLENAGDIAVRLNTLFALILLVGICCEKDKFRRWFYVAAFMALVPGGAHRYTITYFFMPLFVLIQQGIYKQGADGKVRMSKEALYNSIMLGLIFSYPMVGGILTKFNLTFNYYTCTYAEVMTYSKLWIFVVSQFIFSIVHSKDNIVGFLKRVYLTDSKK